MAGSGRSHSKAPECWRAQRRLWCPTPLCLSVTRKGIAFVRLQLDAVGLSAAAAKFQFLLSALISRWGSNTVLFFNMKYTERASLIASTVLALNLLPPMRASNRCANGPIVA